MIQKRQNNFEVLRVLCMLMIIYWHSCVYGMHLLGEHNASFPANVLGMFNQICLQILLAFSAVAVNCYIFITGYFLINTEFRWGKIKIIWRQVAFYCCVIVTIVNLGDFEQAPPLLKGILQFFPILSKQYYFVSNYLALLALAPYLARMASNINQKEFLNLLRIGLLLNLVIYKFTCGYEFPYGSSYGGAYSLMWFLYLFLVGGYIKKYGVCCYLDKRPGLYFIGLSLMLGLFSYYKMYEMGCFQLTINYLDYNGLVFFASLFLFLFFKQHAFTSKFWGCVVKLAPFSFAVYILHDNFYIKRILWNRILKVQDFMASDFCILFMLLIPVVVYSIGIVVESVRLIIFKK